MLQIRRFQGIKSGRTWYAVMDTRQNQMVEAFKNYEDAARYVHSLQSRSVYIRRTFGTFPYNPFEGLQEPKR